MTRSVSTALLGPEFDDFLFAPLGYEKNGMQLSVLSALARLEVDPWQEATNLAGLPGTTATERLASLIASLPNELSTYGDPGTIAARLVGLLPRRAHSNIGSLKTVGGNDAVTHSLLVISAMLTMLALGTAWIAVSHQPSAWVTKAQAPVSETIPPQTLPTSGR